jgi:hypothetical protein
MVVVATTGAGASARHSMGRIALALIILGIINLIGMNTEASKRKKTAQPGGGAAAALHNKPPHIMFKGQEEGGEEQKAVANTGKTVDMPSDGEGSKAKSTTTRITPYTAWKTAYELGVEPEKTKRRNEAQMYGDDDNDGSMTRNVTIFSPQPLILRRTDFIYRKGTWDGAPIVVPELKLLFFTTPKVGCTVFKQLFRRIAGYKNWRTSQLGNGIPHEPNRNGLSYLYHFDKEEATEMLTSAEWTRAMFVREPKDRMLSAYLDKGRKNGGLYITTHCCPNHQTCAEIVESSFSGFLQVIHHCRDPHWASQSRRMERQYWPYLNFMGHIEDAQEDTKRLLQTLGGWESYGASGWGQDGTEPIFASTGTVRHQTGASDKLREYYTDETERMVEDLTWEDFQNPLFDFKLTKVV